MNWVLFMLASKASVIGAQLSTLALHCPNAEPLLMLVPLPETLSSSPRGDLCEHCPPLRPLQVAPHPSCSPAPHDLEASRILGLCPPAHSECPDPLQDPSARARLDPTPLQIPHRIKPGPHPFRTEFPAPNSVPLIEEQIERQHRSLSRQ